MLKNADVWSQSNYNLVMYCISTFPVSVDVKNFSDQQRLDRPSDRPAAVMQLTMTFVYASLIA